MISSCTQAHNSLPKTVSSLYPSNRLPTTLSSFTPYSTVPSGKMPQTRSARPIGTATRSKTTPRPDLLGDWCRDPGTRFRDRFYPAPSLAPLLWPGSRAFAPRSGWRGHGSALGFGGVSFRSLWDGWWYQRDEMDIRVQDMRKVVVGEEQGRLTDALYCIQYSQPQPQRSPSNTTCDRSRYPGQILAYVWRAPEDLSPARSTESHGEYGQHPRMAFRQVGKQIEERNPYADEKHDDQNHYQPRWHCLTRPQVQPVPAVRGG